MIITSRLTAFYDQEIRLLSAIAEIAANAIHRETLNERNRQHAANLATVNAIGHALAETLDLSVVYARLAEAIQNLLPRIAGIIISRFYAETKEITAVYASVDGQVSDVSTLPSLPLQPPGEGTQSQVIHSRQSLLIGNYPKLREQGKFNLYGDLGSGGGEPESVLLVPLLAKGEVLGILQVQSTIPARFTPDDTELLTIVANTAAIAIQNARLFEETQKRLRNLGALHNIDKAITKNFDLDATLNIVLEQVNAQLSVDAADILLFESSNQTLVYAASYGFLSNAVTHTSLRVGRGFAGRAALDRRTMYIPNLDDPQYLLRTGDLEGGPSIFVNPKTEGFVSYFGVPLIARGQVKGVLELYHRNPFRGDMEWLNFLETLARQTAIAIDNSQLFNEQQRSYLELTLTFDTTLEGWAKALELRDKETEGHCQRVIDLTVRLARRLGLSGEELKHLRRGTLLHDIGKMAIPDSILLKPGPLSPEEWEIMRRHPQIAYDLLWPIPFLRPALDIPYCHHEHWDGSGYPRGLKGDQIPMAARIFSVVDVWDAMRNERPYHKAFPDNEVLEHICQQSKKQFDPQVVETFLRLVRENPD